MCDFLTSSLYLRITIVIVSFGYNLRPFHDAGDDCSAELKRRRQRKGRYCGRAHDVDDSLENHVTLPRRHGCNAILKMSTIKVSGQN